MFSKELSELLSQVITSWQVIAVTVALVLYIYLVNYAARRYRRPRFVSKSRPKKASAKSTQAANTAQQDSFETVE
jgi:hypothetical protein